MTGSHSAPGQVVPGRKQGGRNLKTFAKPVLFLLLLLAWILPGLTGHDPWKPDEAYSFGLVNHILETGDLVVPTLAGEPFVEKPPLYYATAAATARLFAPRLPLHDGARLASAFYLSIVFLFAGLTGRELWGKGRGWMTAVVLMGCPGLVFYTHKLVTDVALLAGFAVALYGFSLSARRPGPGGLFLGTGVGIGFLSKGLLAPGIAGLTGILLLLQPEWRTRRIAGALGIALLASLPWLVAWPALLHHRSPQLFEEWFWTQNFGRFFGHVHLGPPRSPGFYLYSLPYLALPALPLAAWGVIRSLRGGGLEPAAKLLLTAFLAMFAVLGAAADAREIYALPMLLPISLLAAPAAFSLPERVAAAASRLGAAAFGAAAIALGLGWFAMVSSRPAVVWHRLHGIHPGYAPSGGGWPVFVAGIILAGWLAALPRLSRVRGGSAAVWAVGTTAAWGLAMTLWLPWLDAGMSYRAVMDAIRNELPGGGATVASAGLGEPQRALLEYMAHIDTQRVETGPLQDNDDFLLVQSAPRQALDPGPGWREIWEGHRAGDDKELFRLFRRETPPS